MNAYDMAKMHQHELLLEAEDWRLAKQVHRTKRVHAPLGKLLPTLAMALTRVAARSVAPKSRPGEIG